MTNFDNFLLFRGIEEDKLKGLITCLSPITKFYEKGEYIFSVNDRAKFVGGVLSGGVYILKEDFWGNRTILTRVDPGGLFGESFSCAALERLPVSVTAAEKTEVFLLDMGRIITSCSSACSFHTQLIRNLVGILAEHNLSLVQKIEHITRRTTREKILSYLSAWAKEAGSPVFEIPFNRQEMADYLSVERSAMSAELSKMREEGLLKYHLKSFELLRSKNFEDG